MRALDADLFLDGIDEESPEDLATLSLGAGDPDDEDEPGMRQLLEYPEALLSDGRFRFSDE
jgi:hypothetical protein